MDGARSASGTRLSDGRSGRVAPGSIGYYLLLVGRRRIGYLLNLDRTTERQRLLVATAACMLYVLIRAVLTGSVSYFLLLVVLAADYFVYDRHERPARADLLPPATGSRPGPGVF